MTVLRLRMTALIALLAAAAALHAPAATLQTPSPQSMYAHLTGQTVLENSRVLVQRYVIEPGQSTGVRTHPGNQLLVFVKGGVLTSKGGRATLWPDGRAVWQDHRADGDDDSTNTGTAPIDLLWITLKPVKPMSAATPSGRKPKYGYLNYPNIPGEDILENDLVIVQRFKMQPGQWEGIHAHNPNTFYIFIKGSPWLSKSREHPEGVPGSAADGTVAWMDTIDISDQHQSGNIGTNESDVVWVALKQ